MYRIMAAKVEQIHQSMTVTDMASQTCYNFLLIVTDHRILNCPKQTYGFDN